MGYSVAGKNYIEGLNFLGLMPQWDKLVLIS